MITPAELKILLLGANLLTADQFEEAKKEAEEKKMPLEEYLPETGLILDEQLGQLIANYYKFNFIDLNKENIEDNVFLLIPEIVAKNNGVLAISRTEQGVRLGMLDPRDLETIHMVRKRVGQEVIPFYITKRAFETAFSHYRKSLTEEFGKILKTLKDETLSREDRDETVVTMVDTLLQYAYQNKTSDIHVEPYRSKALVRFRIDGVMHDVLELSKDLLEHITTRIKILAKMRTDEHMAAQDGKLTFEVRHFSSVNGGNNGEKKQNSKERVDVRVSIVPVTGGENIVMRLLFSKNRQFSLSNLGLADRDLKKVEKAIKNPHGMILVTGPTGSGKTTTLYAVMKILNKRTVHVSTIEDPVEYDIEGISQIQVNPKANLTFAKGLRAIVRQDPDIIMVGEIRDAETADIAINSAMTGHLVLSTLHTNDSATTLPRLLEMGVEPFLVSSTVHVAIAQRLVRQICAKCRTSYALSDREKEMIESNPSFKEICYAKGHEDLSKMRLYKGAGCKVCANTGYIGRIGIFEVLLMEDNIRDLIIKRASSDEIMKAAKANGMTTMFEDGLDKVLAGVTTIEEVLRVAQE